MRGAAQKIGGDTKKMSVLYYILGGSTKNRGGVTEKRGVSYYILGGSTKNRGGATEKRGVSYYIIGATSIKASASSYIIAGSHTGKYESSKVIGVNSKN